MSLSSFLLRFLLSAHPARAWHEGFWRYRENICVPGPNVLCDIDGAGGVSDLLARVTGFVTGIAAGIGVCVFIYACIQMVMSQGQDDKMAAAKKMALIALVGVFLALSADVIISALWAPAPPAPPVGPPAPPPRSILRTIILGP